MFVCHQNWASTVVVINVQERDLSLSLRPTRKQTETHREEISHALVDMLTSSLCENSVLVEARWCWSIMAFVILRPLSLCVVGHAFHGKGRADA